MDQVTQQNAAMVEQSTAASHSLSQETEELTRLIGRFQVGRSDFDAQESELPRRRAKPSAPAPATRTALKTVGTRGGAAPKPVANEWEEF